MNAMNSSSKSKRSFNSMSNNSNPSGSGRKSSGGNSRKKKRMEKDHNQKTLGMAWGANSRSSSRSAAFRSSPFPDFGSYMAVKNHKLHEQFDAAASSSSHSGSSSGKTIFQGVSIFVDGYTVPSSQDLKNYMLQHGGRYENYFSRRRVTHIICSNLPDSKIKNLSGGLPVVKPSWVVESVAANKLLSWLPYQLDRIASENNNQPKLSTFFGAKSCLFVDDVAECSSRPATSEPDIVSSESGLITNVDFFRKSESKEAAKDFHLVSDDLEIAIRSADDASMYLMDDEHEIEFEKDGCNDPSHPQTSSCPALKSTDNSVDNPMTAYSLNLKTTGPASRCHSTLSDANFVENYFKFSRLHFIGTWRNRYRKRFPNPLDWSKDKSSSHNGSAPRKTTIIHVDMDCFFVAVVIRNRPDLKDKPVAICHSDSSRGTAEISSANYPARDHGVKAGMFVRNAKALCPELVIFPYYFDAYEEVADQFYDILHKHCNKVQAVSCDEAFLDVSDSSVEDPSLLASAIRKEILETTGCTASIGIAGNMLMARVATRIAKPNGCCSIPLEQVDSYLHDLPVKALPGIGHVLDEKLRAMQIRTCGQLRMISKESLQKKFGTKTGDMLWNFSRGIDNRMVGVIQETKSVGAEVNWGVRFNDFNDVKDFLLKLCKEVSLRLEGCGVRGRNITLKVKKRRSSAGEPAKFMGCGECENLSRSITLPMATDDVHVLQRITNQLFGYFQIDAKDIRGMGLQASKLEAVDNNRRGHEKCSIRSWLVSSARKDFTTIDACKVNSQVNSRMGLDTVSMAQSDGTGEVAVSREAALPGLQELDIGVIESLPPEVFKEINDLYCGELINLISKNQQNNVDFGMTSIVPQNIADVMDEERSAFEPLDKILCDEEAEYVNGKAHLRAASIGETSSLASVMLPPTDSLMPSSLSQVDPSVLQHLPEELRADILESLPAHRNPHIELNDVSVKYDAAQPASEEFVLKNELWVGNPPKWVDNFAGSSCCLLNVFAELQNSSCPGSQLSSLLQRLVAGFPLLHSDRQDYAFSCLCELIKQYVDFKIETDIEEIYTCSCLLRRLSLRSKLFLRIYDSIIPHFQAAVCEHYGGNLNVCLMDKSHNSTAAAAAKHGSFVIKLRD